MHSVLYIESDSYSYIIINAPNNDNYNKKILVIVKAIIHEEEEINAKETKIGHSGYLIIKLRRVNLKRPEE